MARNQRQKQQKQAKSSAHTNKPKVKGRQAGEFDGRVEGCYALNLPFYRSSEIRVFPHHSEDCYWSTSESHRLHKVA